MRAFYPTHPRTDKLLAQRNWWARCMVWRLLPWGK